MVSHRGECKTRVTGDEAQGTMGRVKKGGEACLACLLFPAFLCAQIFLERERRPGKRQQNSCTRLTDNLQGARRLLLVLVHPYLQEFPIKGQSMMRHFMYDTTCDHHFCGKREARITRLWHITMDKKCIPRLLFKRNENLLYQLIWLISFPPKRNPKLHFKIILCQKM